MKILIGGATATGKSSTSEFIAEKMNGEILSCDASQVYKYMNIGTDKKLNLSVRQHLIDIVEPDQNFSVVDYQYHAQKTLNTLSKSNIIPIIAGGTGLYLDTYLYSQEYGGSNYNDIQKELILHFENELEQKGKQYLYDKLDKLDPIIASKTHPNNTRRVIRYLAIVASGKTPSKLQKTFKLAKNKYIFFILTAPSEYINKQITKRIYEMIDNGLENEIESLLNKGYSFDFQSMKAIGYKEWKPYFYSNEKLENVITRINIHTRQYAKRQRTWFNNQYKCIGNTHFIDITNKNYKNTMINIINKFKREAND